MIFKNKGFTIIEIIVVFLLIGIILVFEMQVIKPRINQYGAPYYSIFNALKKISYNILADLDCPDCHGATHEETPGDPNTRLICNETGQVTICPDGPRKFPLTAQELCKRASVYFNTVEKNTCICQPDDTGAGGGGDIQAVNITPATTDFNQFIDKGLNCTLGFKTTNSLKFYFSNRMNYAPANVDFFIVYVDLNGDKTPNMINHDGTDILPDIVPFALTEKGEVIPMGYPIYSNIYLTAKVNYPFSFDEDLNPINEYSESMTFFEAIHTAWTTPSGANGIVEHNDISFSWDLNNNFLPLEARSAVLTREVLNEDTGKNETITVNSPDITYLTQIINEASEKGRAKGCQGGTFNCKITVDRNTTTRF